MFSSDKPIEKITEDKLNRTKFTKQLAQAILSYESQENFTVSLCGKWGTGKTSIINMLVEEIRESNKEDINTPIIVRFNPWNYSDKAELISQFSHVLMNEIKVKSTSDEMKNVGSVLQKYSEVIEYTTLIPVVGKFLGPLKSIMANLGVNLTEIAQNEENLDNLKNKIEKALREQSQKIIVIIDDIDRLNNEQIRLIFQLVNCVAGFPNMIYLLSFDREVVTRALEEEQKCSGEEYLEKIIQVPFDIPNINVDALHKVFFQQLNEIFNKYPSDSFNKEYWSSIFVNCISPYIETIRDVNRIINVFRFKYGLMHNEVNGIDLLALSTLQICAPETYNWIYENIDRLTGCYGNIGMTGIEQQKNKEKEIEKLALVNKDNPEKTLQVIQALFPKFCWVTGGYTRINETNEEQRRLQKISSPERSKFYFNLSLEEIPVEKTIIMDSITEYNSDEIDEFLLSLIKSRKIKEYLSELSSYIIDIPEERLSLVLTKLINLQTENVINEKKGLFDIVPTYYCSICNWKIFSRMGSKKTSEELTNLIRNADIDIISVILHYVLDIEYAYARIGDSIDNIHQIIEEKSLDLIEKALDEKIKELSLRNNLMDSLSFISIYRFYIYYDKLFIKNYLKNLINESENLIKYLYCFASHWDSSSNEQGWGFNELTNDDIISIDKAYEIILAAKNTIWFSKLGIKYKEIVVAFYLWYNTDRKDYRSITKKKVTTAIPEWEANTAKKDTL